MNGANTKFYLFLWCLTHPSSILIEFNSCSTMFDHSLGNMRIDKQSNGMRVLSVKYRSQAIGNQNERVRERERNNQRMRGNVGKLDARSLCFFVAFPFVRVDLCVYQVCGSPSHAALVRTDARSRPPKYRTIHDDHRRSFCTLNAESCCTALAAFPVCFSIRVR